MQYNTTQRARKSLAHSEGVSPSSEFPRSSRLCQLSPVLERLGRGMTGRFDGSKEIAVETHKIGRLTTDTIALVRHSHMSTGDGKWETMAPATWTAPSSAANTGTVQSV
jgi:hypothetical protein